MKLKWSPTRLLALLALLLTGSVIAIRVTSAEPLNTAATSMVRYVAGLQPVQGPGREMAALRERPALLTGAQPLRASSPYTNPWQLQATLPGAIIKDISFSTSQVGYIAAELGQVWKTTNGGANWTRIMNLGFPYYWYGVAALDANNVVISGFINNAQSGVIRRSTDGGATWTPNITLTTDGWSFRVRFADNLHGFVLDGLNYSAPNAGHYTINGGPTAADWTEVVPDPDGGWFGNQFSLLPNLKTRIAGISYCTSPDVGANWVCGPSIDPVFDGPVFYADDQTGWVGGGSISPSVEGWAHRTTDGGATWSGRTLQAAWPVREFRFVDGQRGWAAGGNIYSNSGGLYFSSDGGQTWSLDASTGAEMDACDSRDTGSGQQVWCAGYTGSFNGVVYTLLPGTTTTPTPVPSSTSTISAPTNTVPVPTMTATHTATQLPVTSTPCRLTFTDVPPDSTFYTFIRCLACRGIISGYADDTFRPNNLVTRGQLAKIVSNAAGFTEDPEPQIFEDVPPANTFYQWINRLARRGHMSGYVCGGVGEPCTTGMPYFRPFANATRGQTSKIVSNAAGYSEIPTDQTFEDVPPTHTFYREIQRLATRNIMQGYACGGVGEPCLTGRPYFRPANNVTRGQSAKIVANTFYPNCETPANR